MLRFSLLGIPVAVQPWFWVTMAILGGGGSANSKEALMRLVLFVGAGFVSILVHEMGHALTGRAFGARVAVVLEAFGGYAQFGGVAFSRVQHFLVTAAGPALQVLLGLAILLAVPDLWRAPGDGGYFWRSLAVISLFWALLNLLPVLPLDGGQMLHAVMGPARVKITLWISIGTAVVAALLVFKLFGSVLFPLFLGFFAYRSWQELKERY